MKLLHTADLHLGQVIYQNYDRVDEHEHFFRQLITWCKSESPDALIVSGDIFDISQPGAAVKKFFTDRFVEIHSACPNMEIVIISGNHDSASRIQENSSVWKFVRSHLIGLTPTMDENGGISNWRDFVIQLKSGFIVGMPYMSSDRSETVKFILGEVSKINSENLPVVLMGHLAVTGSDFTGHDFEIGTLMTQDIAGYGTGYDYFALGHIHKPQTIGHEDDAHKEDVTYPSGVARYSGSALHVSCDEKYPHTVSAVDIPRRGGDVRIRQLRVDELRHFYELPSDGGYFTSDDDAVNAIRNFSDEKRRGYFRLRLNYGGIFRSDFNERIFKTIERYNGEIRFNPKHIWSAAQKSVKEEGTRVRFEIAEIVQMSDPLKFIKDAGIECPGLGDSEIADMFVQVAEEVKRIEEGKQTKSRK